MTKSKRNLLISVLVLILTVAIAGGSTYAWFTTNQRVTVADMDVNVTTGTQGLYISPLEAGPYKTYLSADDLVTAGFVAGNIKLDAVTSADGKAFKNILDTPLTHGGPTVESSWVEFKIFFRATGSQADGAPKVDLSQLALTSTGSREFFNGLKAPITPGDFGRTTAADPIAVGGKIEADSMHAARMSFESMVSGASAGTLRTYDPFKGNSGTFCGVTPFNNSEKANNFAYYYYNALAAIQGNTALGEIPMLASTEDKAAFEKNVLQFSWNAATNAWEGALKIRIWLEGYDGDCVNAILGGSVKAQIEFKVSET